MLDPVTSIGLVASIAQLVDVGTRIYKRISEFQCQSQEVPENFRSIHYQLNLLTGDLRWLKTQLEDDKLDLPDDRAKSLKELIVETLLLTNDLEMLIAKILPPANASSLRKGVAALKSIAKEEKVERAAGKIRDCRDWLVSHQVTTIVDYNLRILQLSPGRSPSPLPSTPAQTTNDIHDAIKVGDVAKVKQLVRLGVPISGFNTLGYLPIHHAAAVGNSAVLQFLLKNGADVNSEAADGKTPLHIAVIKDHLHVVMLLRAAQADDRRKDDDDKLAEDYIDKSNLQKLWITRHGDIRSPHVATGNTVLIYAAMIGNVTAITDLAKEVPLEATNLQGKTALHMACIFNHVDTAQKLLDLGADPNRKDADDYSPLGRSIWAGNDTATKALLETGLCKLEARQGPKRQTVLHEAAWAQNWKIAFLLLEHGADIKTQDFNTNTILHTAIFGWVETPMLERLLKLGADPKIHNRMRWTAMDEALSRKRWDVAKLMLKHGYDGNARWVDDTYPLISYTALMSCSDFELYKALVDHGADINACNIHGWTALQEACNNGGLAEIVHVLLELGADPNTRINTEYYGLEPGSTPLMHIATGMHKTDDYFSGMFKVIGLLLDAGADIEAQDSRGWTALRYAIEFGRDRNACLLLTRGANPLGVVAEARSKQNVLPQFCALLKSVGF